jgi:hypothetical protein
MGPAAVSSQKSVPILPALPKLTASARQFLPESWDDPVRSETAQTEHSQNWKLFSCLQAASLFSQGRNISGLPFLTVRLQLIFFRPEGLSPEPKTDRPIFQYPLEESLFGWIVIRKNSWPAPLRTFVLSV